MAAPPTGKTRDSDFYTTLYSLSSTATTRGQTDSPVQQAPLGAEPVALSEEAFRLRGEVIAKLLPQLKQLTTDLNQLNLRGGVGHGELALLGELQHWLLQLLVEQDELRLARAAEPPPAK